MSRDSARLPLGALGPAGERSHGLPLYQSTNFVYPDAAASELAAQGGGYLYSRHGNPTVAALESCVADLEGATDGVAFSSGQGAVAGAIGALVRVESTRRAKLAEPVEVLASEGLYGGTTEFLREMGPQMGFVPRFVPGWNTEAVAAALTPRTRVVVVETLSNPLLRVADLPMLGRLCRQRGVALLVDNTFASPRLCRPLEHGAHVVVHSASKFLAGHGDVIAGVVCGDAKTMAGVKKFRTLMGSNLDPFAAWLVCRGVRTLAVRIERSTQTALALAHALENMPTVRRVIHPGLSSHPDFLRARFVLDAPGALLSFELQDLAAARGFYDRVALIGRAASLGEASSLLTHPATFSHKGLPAAERARLGITDGLLRLSVGLEDPRDLMADVISALAGAPKRKSRS